MEEAGRDAGVVDKSAVSTTQVVEEELVGVFGLEYCVLPADAGVVEHDVAYVWVLADEVHGFLGRRGVCTWLIFISPTGRPFRLISR